MTDTAQPTWMHRLRYTPMRDLLRGRVSGRLDLAGRIAAAKLPAPAAELVSRVIRRTRLWRLEKVGVADELIAHFQDGLEAGRAVEELVASFGDERQAAKLIRRAKIRNRPLWWQAQRWVQRLIVALVMLYLTMLGYFMLGHPSPSVDYVAALNRPILSLPEAERAWPIYRRAALNLQDSRASVSLNGPLTLKAYPDWVFNSIDGKHWSEMTPWLRKHSADLALIRQAAGKSAIGFVLGSSGSEHDPELWPTIGAPASATRPEQPQAAVWRQLFTNSLLTLHQPYVSELRVLAFFLQADAKLAVVDRDAGRFAADMTATLDLAQQLKAQHTWVFDSVMGMEIYNIAVESIDRQLAHDPAMLADAQWIALAHQLAGPQVAADMIDFSGDRAQFNDIIQRLYTDDGHGDGRMTPQGLRFFIVGMEMYGTPYFDREWTSALLGPATLPMVASRKEILTEYERLMQPAVNDLQKPLREVGPSQFEATLLGWRSSPVMRIRYAPLVAFVSSLNGLQARAEQAMGHRDGVIIGIALELYRRERGAYPATLAELTPVYLPSVLADRITGEPVKYRLVDGKPLVYSVGFDRIDDGGVPVMRGITPSTDAAAVWGDRAGMAKVKGDWLLYPVPAKPENEDEE